MSALLALAAYGVALVACHGRWGARGVFVLALLAVGVDVARGTLEWRRPHDDWSHPAGVRAHDWECHSLGLVAPINVFTSAGLIALTIVKRAAMTGWIAQIAGVLVAFALSLPFAFISAIAWTIGKWGCDTI